jgi:hypothetical protein
MAVNPLGFLGMLDKLDDIVYEPVKLVCDGLRQPLKQIDAANERKKMEMEAKLQREAEAFAIEMQIHQKREEAEIELDIRQRHAEIDDMIADKEFERNQKIVEAIKQYQEDLSNAAAKLLQCIGSMNIELRDRAHRMCIDKTRKYKEIQEEAMDQMMARMEQIHERFPEPSPARTMMEGLVSEQAGMIVTRANEFLHVMTQDMQQLSQNFDAIAKEAVDMVKKQLSPLQVREISGALKGGNEYEMKRLPE